MCQINFYSWTENVAYHDYERQQELIVALKRPCCRRVMIMTTILLKDFEVDRYQAEVYILAGIEIKILNFERRYNFC